MEQKELSGGVVLLRADEGMILRRKGGDAFRGHRSVTVRVSDVELYEEVGADAVLPYTKYEYHATVAAMVRERYSADEEFALQRKMINTLLQPMAMSDEAAEAVAAEYAAYNAYVEQCKADAPQVIIDRHAAEDETADKGNETDGHMEKGGGDDILHD